MGNGFYKNKFIKKLNKIDKKIFILIFNIANKNKFMKKITYFITVYSVYVCLCLYVITYVYICIHIYKYRFIDIIKYAFVPFIAIIISKIIKKKIKAKRPFEKLDIKSIVYHKKGSSFPSNHSASVSAVAVSIFYMLGEKYAGYLIVLAIVVGLSRIMAGIHYPKDVAGGFFIGTFVSIVGFYMLF